MRNLTHIIIALAVFFQAMIPLGFMPNAKAAETGRALVICSGLGTKTIHVDDHNVPVKDKKSKSEASPCLYSGATALNKPDPFSVIPARTAYTESHTPVLASQLSGGIKYLLPQAIGPPILL